MSKATEESVALLEQLGATNFAFSVVKVETTNSKKTLEGTEEKIYEMTEKRAVEEAHWKGKLAELKKIAVDYQKAFTYALVYKLFKT